LAILDPKLPTLLRTQVAPSSHFTMASNYTLTFQRDNTMNTILTASDGTQVYDVSTPFHLLGNGHVTSVSRLSEKNDPTNSEGDLVGAFRPKCFGTDMVEFQGNTMPLKEWLPKPSMFSSTRSFVYTKNSSKYEWKYRNGGYQFQDSSGRVIAFFTPSRMGWFSSSGGRPASLSIAFPEAGNADMVDTIVVSFLVAEQVRRHCKRAQRRAAGGVSCMY